MRTGDIITFASIIILLPPALVGLHTIITRVLLRFKPKINVGASVVFLYKNEGNFTPQKTEKLFLRLGFINKRSIPGIIEDIALKMVMRSRLRTSEEVFYPDAEYEDFPKNYNQVGDGDEFRPVFIREKSVVYKVFSFKPTYTSYAPSIYGTPHVIVFIKTDRSKRWRTKKSFNIFPEYAETTLEEGSAGEEAYSLERVELFTRDLEGKLRTGDLVDKPKTRYFSHMGIFWLQAKMKISHYTWGITKKWVSGILLSLSVIREGIWAWLIKPFRDLYWSRVIEQSRPTMGRRVSINRSELAKEALDLYNYFLSQVKAAVELINTKRPEAERVNTTIPEKDPGSTTLESFWVYRNRYTLMIELRGGIVRFKDSGRIYGGTINFEVIPVKGFFGDWFCRKNVFRGPGKLIYIDRIVPAIMDTFFLYSKRY